MRECGQRRLVTAPVGADGAVGAFDCGIAGGELLGIEVKEGQRLLQYKEVLFAPGAGEGQGDLIFILVTAQVAEGSEDVGIAFAGDDGADDIQAGLAGDIAEHLRKLEIHLQQGFLHVQNVGTAVLDELRAVAQQGAQGDQIGVGTEGVGEQAVTMQRLNPLRVVDIGFAARHTLGSGGIDETTVQVVLL